VFFQYRRRVAVHTSFISVLSPLSYPGTCTCESVILVAGGLVTFLTSLHPVKMDNEPVVSFPCHGAVWGNNTARVISHWRRPWRARSHRSTLYSSSRPHRGRTCHTIRAAWRGSRWFCVLDSHSPGLPANEYHLRNLVEAIAPNLDRKSNPPVHFELARPIYLPLSSNLQSLRFKGLEHPDVVHSNDLVMTQSSIYIFWSTGTRKWMNGIGATMVELHMFFLGSTSFIYWGWPRGGPSHCLIDPSFTRLGCHRPPPCFADYSHLAGVDDRPERFFAGASSLEMPLPQSISPLPPPTSHGKATLEISNASTSLNSEFPAFSPLCLTQNFTPLGLLITIERVACSISKSVAISSISAVASGCGVGVETGIRSGIRP